LERDGHGKLAEIGLARLLGRNRHVDAVANGYMGGKCLTNGLF
jgi:hypothetical protein